MDAWVARSAWGASSVCGARRALGTKGHRSSSLIRSRLAAGEAALQVRDVALRPALDRHRAVRRAGHVGKPREEIGLLGGQEAGAEEGDGALGAAAAQVARHGVEPPPPPPPR